MGDQVLTEQSSIPRDIFDLLRNIGSNSRLPICIVGGFVRDLLLGSENLDLDIVVEGDAISFTQKLGENWGWEVQAHRRFGTATLIQPSRARIDFASARSETYERPGALPLVSPGTMEEDLRRRDFSINALAVRLNAKRFGELVDCCDGVKDLRSGRVRALHSKSFIDDPTRIFRAVRYEGRYGFQIESEDRTRICEAIEQDVLDLISGERIRNEINRILAEDAVPRMIQRLRQFQVFRAIHPEWVVTQDFDSDWVAVQDAIDWVDTKFADDNIEKNQIAWLSLLGATHWNESRSLHEGTPTHVIQAITDRMVLPHRLRRMFQTDADLGVDLAKGIISEKKREILERNGISLSRNITIRDGNNRWLVSDGNHKKTFIIRRVNQSFHICEIQTELAASQYLCETLDTLSPGSKPSEVYHLLKPYAAEALVFAMMQPGQPGWRVEKIEDYLINLRKIEPLITGDDLIQIGLQPGKAFTNLISKAFAAQLDGEISTKQKAYEVLGFDDAQSI
ncbi:MAG: hypothetical protein OXN17_16410 [Candidatus Poribacteria bacterium]|nr:hypothetical protein [Candidatus Poribacteria bacterium]MDE0504954.1 hypothetical protein [Candidatus Poribacteria bacterium]